jgi:spore maturation protein CgeB
MASGTLLLTDQFVGYENLFGDKKLCKFYNRDRSDLVEVAKSIVNGNTEELQEIVDRGVKEINMRHLDMHRIREFKNILTTFLEHGRVEKIWGI